MCSPQLQHRCWSSDVGCNQLAFNICFNILNPRTFNTKLYKRTATCHGALVGLFSFEFNIGPQRAFQHSQKQTAAALGLLNVAFYLVVEYEFSAPAAEAPLQSLCPLNPWRPRNDSFFASSSNLKDVTTPTMRHKVIERTHVTFWLARKLQRSKDPNNEHFENKNVINNVTLNSVYTFSSKASTHTIFWREQKHNYFVLD